MSYFTRRVPLGTKCDLLRVAFVASHRMTVTILEIQKALWTNGRHRSDGARQANRKHASLLANRSVWALPTTSNPTNTLI
jgi:hypothetical protein